MYISARSAEKNGGREQVEMGWQVEIMSVGAARTKILGKEYESELRPPLS